VVVSLGPQPVKVTVPSLITMSKSDAQNAILAKGLVPFVSELVNPDPATHGFVYDQDPASGTKVDAGSTVIIYVGKA
jgi:beta-lactam-binding protein with PASTA domain